MANYEHAPDHPTVTRRQFLRHSAAMTAAVASSSAALRAAEEASKNPTVPSLHLPPLSARPTEHSIFISALNGAVPGETQLDTRREESDEWQPFGVAQKASAYQFFNWDVTGLAAATTYQYRMRMRPSSADEWTEVAQGSFKTQRKTSSVYTAVLITDPHTGSFPPSSQPALTLDRVVANASKENAEFVLALGDNVAWAGSREYPQTNPQGAVSAYALYRRQIGPLVRNCPHFSILGNWAGESGKFPERSIQMVSEVRRAFLPNPNHETYPEGGSEREDYYAFQWGDVLYVMLNVQTYSKPSQPEALTTLMADVNRLEDWTLGETQMAWLEKTLESSTQPFRFVCMHHPAGGRAGDELNTLYGRGGARACHTGEQRRIHELMKKHKVQIFFYGHDHVFVDDVVDGIHYTLPGSCGAPWKFTEAETGYERFWSDSGHARLEVTPDKATVTFVNLEGQEIHQFSVLPV